VEKSVLVKFGWKWPVQVAECPGQPTQNASIIPTQTEIHQNCEISSKFILSIVVMTVVGIPDKYMSMILIDS